MHPLTQWNPPLGAMETTVVTNALCTAVQHEVHVLFTVKTCFVCSLRKKCFSFFSLFASHFLWGPLMFYFFYYFPYAARTCLVHTLQGRGATDRMTSQPSPCPKTRLWTVPHGHSYTLQCISLIYGSLDGMYAGQGSVFHRHQTVRHQ